MKNAIRLLLCTCLLLVDAGIISNRGSEETVVHLDGSGNVALQPSTVAQPHSQKSGGSGNVALQPSTVPQPHSQKNDGSGNVALQPSTVAQPHSQKSDGSGNVALQPSTVAQPHSQKSDGPEKPPGDRMAEMLAETPADEEDSNSDGKLTLIPGIFDSIKTPADEIGGDGKMVPNPDPEPQVKGFTSEELPVYEDLYSSVSETESDSLKHYYVPLQSPPPLNPYSIPSSYDFDSKIQNQLYSSLIQEIGYKMKAIVRRQSLIIKYVKCSCPNAKKCRKPHMDELKSTSWDWNAFIPKQFQFPGFSASNYFTQPLDGMPFGDYILTVLSTFKSAIEKITLRQNIIYQYTLCSCNKINECSDKIKPVLDALFSIDINLLTPFNPFEGSLFNQSGLGLTGLDLGFGSKPPQSSFGTGEEYFGVSKPNITHFGSGNVSGTIYSGTIGESSHPSGTYFGTYVSSSSDKNPGAGAASGVVTSCVETGTCEGSGSASIQIDGNKPEEIQVALNKPPGNNPASTVNQKPPGSLQQAIAELTGLTSNITSSLGAIGGRQSDSTLEIVQSITSGFAANLTETLKLARELLDKLTSGLLNTTGSQSSKPQQSTSDSVST